jgi:hypothetical protein
VVLVDPTAPTVYMAWSDPAFIGVESIEGAQIFQLETSSNGLITANLGWDVVTMVYIDLSIEDYLIRGRKFWI